MSKSISVTWQCPSCDSRASAKLWRVIWGETPANRDFVFSDEINMVTCDRCGYRDRAPLALMYVDLEKGFVVWYEPIHDPEIDKEIPAFAATYGQDCAYVTAPRICDWEEFKSTIRKFERGELRAKRPELTNPAAGLKMLLGHARPKDTGRAGCAVTLLVWVGTGAVLGGGLILLNR